MSEFNVANVLGMNIKKAIFIGYDKVQPDAYKVCAASIRRYNNEIPIVPLKKENLPGRYWRQRDPTQSTDFTYLRFAAPALLHWGGISLYCDSDFLWRGDIQDVFNAFDPQYAVQVVQNDIDYVNSPTKMDGQPNEWYPRKWWSSLMLFNNPKAHRTMGMDVVNVATPQYLHRFEWTDSLGSLPIDFNYLVNYHTSADCADPLAVHFTDGTPLHPGQENCEYADEWLEYYNAL